MPERTSDRIANMPTIRLRRTFVGLGQPWPPVGGGKIIHVTPGEQAPGQPGLWVYHAEQDAQS